MATTSLSNSPMEMNTASTRLVWVLNRDTKPYKGVYRTKNVVIPANMERIPKRFDQGGNLMPYLEARRFIVDFKEPQDYVMDSQGKPQPIYGPKALMSEEMTSEEYAKYIAKPVDLKAVEKEDKKARRNLTAELKKRGNKISLEDETEAL